MKPLHRFRFFLLILLLLGFWTAGGAAQQDGVEEVPLTEQELLEMEMEAAEQEIPPPDEGEEVIEEAVTPLVPAVPVPPPARRRPVPAVPAATGADTALEPAIGGDLVPDSIEVTDVRNVTYFDGQISVEFRKVPAGEALEEIGALAGFTVITDAAIGKKPLSVRFDDQPLEKGLTRIIRLIEAGNYRYYYNDEGRLETVVVTASSQSITEEPVRRPAAANRTPVTRPSSTRRRSAVRQRPTTYNQEAAPPQETPTVIRRSNVTRRPAVTPDTAPTAPTQGTMYKNWVTPPGIPATTEP